jgi:hypothetical protein
MAPATVCDHVTPHRGDVAKFWSGPFQSLCQPCHDREKQRAEAASRLPAEPPSGPRGVSDPHHP